VTVDQQAIENHRLEVFGWQQAIYDLIVNFASPGDDTAASAAET